MKNSRHKGLLSLNRWGRIAIFGLLCSIAHPCLALERLTIDGKILRHNGTPVFLQGMNVLADSKKLSVADVQLMADMGVNFVRLLCDADVPFDEFDAEGDGDYLDQETLDDWKMIVGWFTLRNIWVHVEFRWNDHDLADSDVWVPGSALHTKYTAMWVGIVNALKGYDYIASWGLLAEHSQGNRSIVKAAFAPVMQAIDAISGGNTPFCFGPKLNNIDYYDRTQYTDWYWPAYANRIIYQINHLHPKPFIANDPLIGYDPATWWYHRTDGQDGDGADNDDSMHKAGNLAHLQPGIDWRDYYNAPIYIDQWGCASDQPGYMDYESDLLEIFKEQGNIHHTRWIYKQSNSRGVYGHPPLLDFWKMALAESHIWPHVAAYSDYRAQDNHLTTEASGSSLPWNIDFEFSAPFACNKIELWSGNTAAADDPATVEIYGSNTGSSWDYLATAGNINFTGRRAQYFSPAFTNTVAYSHYRAKVTANHGGSKTVVSNLEFFPGSKGIPAGTMMTQTVTQTVNEDTFAYKSEPGTSYGFDPVLTLRSRVSSFSRVSFLKFTVAPGSAPMVSAILKLYSTDQSGTVSAYEVADNSWTETNLTWSTMPAAGALIGSGAAVTGDWFQIDVTDYISGNGTFSIALEEQANVRGRLSSREGDHPPMLEITQLLSPVITNYQSWAFQYGLFGADSGKDADPDVDGSRNIFEYAFGGNPTNQNDGTSVFPMFVMPGTGSPWLDYVYRRRQTAADIDYVVEATTNLVSNSWSTNGVLITGSGMVESGLASVTNRIGTEDRRKFIRLKIIND